MLSVTGSPLQFYVDAINSGHVTAYGPGLSHGTMNRPATFTIVTEDAGEGSPHMYTSRYKSCLKPEPSSSRAQTVYDYLISEI